MSAGLVELDDAQLVDDDLDARLALYLATYRERFGRYPRNVPGLSPVLAPSLAP